MKLFGSKKKTQFFTAAERMIDDAHITDSSKSALLTYMASQPPLGMDTSLSLPKFIIEASQNSIAFKSKKAYQFAHNNHYAYGAVTAQNSHDSTTPVYDQIKPILEARLGYSIDLVYAHLEEPNYYHMLWAKLINTQGYNPKTNELTLLSGLTGFSCYMTTAQMHYTQNTMDALIDESYLEQWGWSTESGATVSRVEDRAVDMVPFSVGTTFPEDYVEVSYEYLEIIPDTTPPPAPQIQSFDGTVLTGVAEQNSTITVLVSGSSIATGVADATGHFSITLGTSTASVDVSATDSSSNVSTLTTVASGYVNGTTLPDGPAETQTEFLRTGSFTMDFLDVIASNDPNTTASFVEEKSYLMALYTYNDGTEDHVEYLTYEYGSGGDADWDNLVSFSPASGQYFPRLYARLGGVDLSTQPKTTPEYKSSRRLAKTLGIDYANWVKSLHEGIPEAGSANQMFLMQAAPVNTTDPVILEYLFHFFGKLHDATVDTFSNARELVRKGQSLAIADTVARQTVSYTGIIKDTRTGILTTDYESTYVPAVITYIRYTPRQLQPPYHRLRRKIDETSYEEIRIYDLSVNYSFGGGGTNHVGTSEMLLIPLDYSSLPQLSHKEQEVLLQKCLYLFLNVIKVIKVKWYQRGIFKVVLAVASIAISFFSVGAGAPLSTYLLAAATAVATGVAISFAASALSKLLVKLGVSAKLVLDITVVLAVVAIATGAFNVKGLLDVSMKTFNLALDFSTKLVASINNRVMEAIQKDSLRFQAQSKAQQKELMEARKLLNTRVATIDELLLESQGRMDAFITLGETPDEFINKSYAIFQAVPMSYTIVSNYVDIALTLPRNAKFERSRS